MMHEIKTQLTEAEATEIDQLFRTLDNVSVLQHPLWPDDLNEAQGKRFFLLRDKDKIALSAKIIESKLRRTPFIKFAHVPFGPLSNSAIDIVKFIEEAYPYYRGLNFANLSIQLINDLQQAQYIERSILKDGIELFHGPHNEFKSTIALPLKENIDDIFSSFSTNLRRNINKAYKNKIQVRVVTSAEEFESFPPIYQKMEASRGVHLYSDRHLKDIFKFVNKTNLGYFLAAYNDRNIMIGGMFLLRQGKRLEYIIGATDPLYKNLPQSHLTFFEAIKLAKQEAFELFDFGGFGFNAKEGDQIYDINRFKLNFTDNIIFYPRALVFKPNKINALIGKNLLKVEKIISRSSSASTPKLKVAEPTLRVLLVERTMTHGGGAESLVFNIYKELKKMPEVHVKLVALQKSNLFKINDGDYFEKQLARDPDFHFCNSQVSLSVLGPNQSNVSEFKEIVKSFRPHVIHSHLFIAELVAHEVVFSGVKYFTHCHDNMRQFRNFSFNTLFKKELLTDFYEKWHLVARYTACNNSFISISEDTKKYFESVLPNGLKKNIHSLDNAIEIESFNKANRKRDLNKIRIVNVGSFQAKKNQKFLVDIAEELLKRGTDVEIVMLGDGALYKEVKERVKNKGMEKNILMPGNVVNVEDYYGAANIYVHTATYEPFGLVLIEAMASGLPVVSLDGKGNRLLIKNGENGYMIYEQDAIKFADFITQIISNENVYETMSQKAAAFSNRYDMSEYVKKLMLLYRKAD